MASLTVSSLKQLGEDLAIQHPFFKKRKDVEGSKGARFVCLVFSKVTRHLQSQALTFLLETHADGL